MMDRLLNEREAAAALGVSVKTLQRWRCEGRGPSFRRMSARCVRYAERDLQGYIEGIPAVRSTAEAAQAAARSARSGGARA